MITLWHLGYIRPFESWSYLLLEFTNETFLAFILYHMICFTEIVNDARVRTDAGISCVVFTSIILLINLCVIFSGILYKLKLLIKRYQNRKRAEKLMQMRRLRGISLLEQSSKAGASDLERKIIAVEVKAKQTSYLMNLKSNGKFKIHANAASNLQLSNLNKGVDTNGIKKTEKAAPSNIDPIRSTTPSLEAGSQRKFLPQIAAFDLDMGVYQKYKGFNVDL